MSACLCVADCKICSAVHKDVSLFLTGTTEEYVQEVARYRNESVILKNAESLKECIDGKMTEDDKKNAVNVLVSPALCVYAAGACLGVCSGQGAGGRWSPFFFSTMPHGEVERMVWERLSPALELLNTAQPPAWESAAPPVSLASPGLGVRPSALASRTPASPTGEPGYLNC